MQYVEVSRLSYKKEYKMTITDTDADVNEAWDQLVKTCNGDVKKSNW
jgi:hypothetical protein